MVCKTTDCRYKIDGWENPQVDTDVSLYEGEESVVPITNLPYTRGRL